MRRLRAFIPTVQVRLCEVRTGPNRDDHVHSGLVAFLVGSVIWEFMLLDIVLFAPKDLVRPVASAGQSVRCTPHPSWADNVGEGGASHPSFAAFTLARESTIIAANNHVTLRVVPMMIMVSIDGTAGGNKLGRTSLVPIACRCAWLTYARLSAERGYTVLALCQANKLSAEAASENSAPALRSSLMQDIFACLSVLRRRVNTISNGTAGRDRGGVARSVRRRTCARSRGSRPGLCLRREW